MRADAVLRVILNVSLFPQMSLSDAQSASAMSGNRFVKFVGFEDGVPTQFAVRLKNPETVIALQESIKRAMPPDAEQNEEKVSKAVAVSEPAPESASESRSKDLDKD